MTTRKRPARKGAEQDIMICASVPSRHGFYEVRALVIQTDDGPEIVDQSTVPVPAVSAKVKR